MLNALDGAHKFEALAAKAKEVCPGCRAGSALMRIEASDGHWRHFVNEDGSYGPAQHGPMVECSAGALHDEMEELRASLR